MARSRAPLLDPDAHSRHLGGGGGTRRRRVQRGCVCFVVGRPQRGVRAERDPRIDVFNSTFGLVTTPSRAFKDPLLAPRFAPFNVQERDGKVFVTYAKVDPSTGEELKGRGLGFVDEYTADGRLIARVASGKTLNGPAGSSHRPVQLGYRGRLVAGGQLR
jgi:uncharacterized protein (TIGR03118 family)